MRRIYIALIISLFWISFASSQDYFPLREGNRWAYVMSNNVQLTVQVTGFTEIDGVRCAIVESTTDSATGTVTSREYLAVDTEGLKVYISHAQDQEVVYNPPLTRIKLPFVQEQIWTSTISQADTDLVTTFEALGKKQIQTNLGTFQCIVIGSRANLPGQTSMMSVSYYADGVGLVRQEMQIGNQSIIASLNSANVKPTEKIETPKPAEIRCPNCNAVNNSSAKFCSQCGTALNASTSENVQEGIIVDVNEEATFDLYKSSLRKLMFYKPRNWNVAELQYDNGVNVTSIVRPDETALVVFLSFPEGEDVNDSVSLSETCIDLFRNNIPDLEGDNIKTSPDKDLTTMDISFTEGDAKGIGHAYFFYTDRIGTAYLLLARDDIWEQIRPTLLNIVSNIAYSTQDVELVMNIGITLASENLIAEQEQIPNPAFIIQKAGKILPEEIEFVSSGLTDESITLEIPQGWHLEGRSLQFSPRERELYFLLTDDEILKNCGMISKSQMIVPTQVTTSGVINSTYQSPPEILSFVFNYEDIGTDMEILGEIPCEQLNTVFAKEAENMSKLRYQVDSRLIYAKYQNIVTEKIFLGIFSVQCITMPMSSEWEFSIDGCWAPENEFGEFLPLFLKISKTIQITKQPAQNDKEKEIQILQQLNRNFLNSIADYPQTFTEYIKINQNRNYTSWMRSQTTLGQGTWIAQNEGAEVYQTNSWGIENKLDDTDNLPYNKASFIDSREQKD
ncbi:MAG: zinc ribbon domain-containing protein [Sedimentisphaerales bacterium]|nr:zinc ribbon domain-containing protein [Sedimentisphaerales bacterium]